MQNHLSPDLKRKIAFYLKSIIEKSRSQRIKIKKVNPFSNPMATYTVRLINAEKNLDVAIAVPEDQYILDMAEEAGIRLPSGCLQG